MFKQSLHCSNVAGADNDVSNKVSIASFPQQPNVSTAKGLTGGQS